MEKKYEITEEQRQDIIRILGEVPAKWSIDLINFFKALRPIDEKEKKKASDEPA